MGASEWPGRVRLCRGPAFVRSHCSPGAHECVDGRWGRGAILGLTLPPPRRGVSFPRRALAWSG